MCKFMSCVSNGHGEVKFFTIQNIVEIMSEGNPKSYEWNSHTSICQFHGIGSKKEDSWNMPKGLWAFVKALIGEIK